MAGHKRNEKTVRPPLKNLRGIQMLDFFQRCSLFVDRAYEAFIRPLAVSSIFDKWYVDRNLRTIR